MMEAATSLVFGTAVPHREADATCPGCTPPVAIFGGTIAPGGEPDGALEVDEAAGEEEGVERTRTRVLKSAISLVKFGETTLLHL
jgi:hypothetical protein